MNRMHYICGDTDSMILANSKNSEEDYRQNYEAEGTACIALTPKIHYIYNPLPTENEKDYNYYKGSALRWLCMNQFHCSMRDVCAIGDGESDREMLEQCGFSYAPSNGTKEAKEAAKVTLSCNMSEKSLNEMYSVGQRTPGSGTTAVQYLKKFQMASPRIVSLASAYIFKLSDAEDMRREIIQAGGIAALIMTVRRYWETDTEITWKALRAIFALLIDDETKSQFTELGGIVLLKESLTRFVEKDLNIMNQLFLIVRILTKDEQSLQQMIHGGIIQASVISFDFFFGKEVETMELLMSVFASFAESEEGFIILQNCGGIKAMIDSANLYFEQERIVKLTCATIRKLAGRVDSKEDIISLGGIKIILKVLAEYGIRDPILAASCLSTIVFLADEYKDIIVKEDGVNICVQILEQLIQIEAVVQSICGILAFLANDDQLAVYIVECGVVKPILAALRRHGQKSIAISRIICGLLALISRNEQGQKEVISNGGIECLLNSSKQYGKQLDESDDDEERQRLEEQRRIKVKKRREIMEKKKQQEIQAEQQRQKQIDRIQQDIWMSSLKKEQREKEEEIRRLQDEKEKEELLEKEKQRQIQLEKEQQEEFEKQKEKEKSKTNDELVLNATTALFCLSSHPSMLQTSLDIQLIPQLLHLASTKWKKRKITENVMNIVMRFSDDQSAQAQIAGCVLGKRRKKQKDQKQVIKDDDDKEQEEQDDVLILGQDLSNGEEEDEIIPKALISNYDLTAPEIKVLLKSVKLISERILTILLKLSLCPAMSFQIDMRLVGNEAMSEICRSALIFQKNDVNLTILALNAMTRFSFLMGVQNDDDDQMKDQQKEQDNKSIGKSKQKKGWQIVDENVPQLSNFTADFDLRTLSQLFLSKIPEIEIFGDSYEIKEQIIESKRKNNEQKKGIEQIEIKKRRKSKLLKKTDMDYAIEEEYGFNSNFGKLIQFNEGNQGLKVNQFIKLRKFTAIQLLIREMYRFTKGPAKITTLLINVAMNVIGMRKRNYDLLKEKDIGIQKEKEKQQDKDKDNKQDENKKDINKIKEIQKQKTSESEILNQLADKFALEGGTHSLLNILLFYLHDTTSDPIDEEQYLDSQIDNEIQQVTKRAQFEAEFQQSNKESDKNKQSKSSGSLRSGSNPNSSRNKYNKYQSVIRKAFDDAIDIINQAREQERLQYDKIGISIDIVKKASSIVTTLFLQSSLAKRQATTGKSQVTNQTNNEIEIDEEDEEQEEEEQDNIDNIQQQHQNSCPRAAEVLLRCLQKFGSAEIGKVERDASFRIAQSLLAIIDESATIGKMNKNNNVNINNKDNQNKDQFDFDDESDDSDDEEDEEIENQSSMTSKQKLLQQQQKQQRKDKLNKSRLYSSRRILNQIISISGEGLLLQLLNRFDINGDYEAVNIFAKIVTALVEGHQNSSNSFCFFFFS
ncbi:MAG: hypothetical protein EZS28_008187 [Streblomastix strix]|uniref:Uncharacterized protein n=1 Tax=Streblomastix strix TaxID=222440 RepID=A0A5J4WMI3_9EUKA|nr:MAG: hypothetical protein EZS28_008187 [Streblomastix strix]